MKRLFLIITIALSHYSFSQDRNCECLVKLYDGDLIVQLKVGRNIPEEYNSIRPKPGQKFSYNKIVKDSSTLWFIKPQSRDTTAKLPIFKMKKLANTFLTEV